MTEGELDLDHSNPDPLNEWEAFARHLTGEATPEESARIEALLAGRPQDRELLSALDQMVSGMAADIPTDIDIDSALNQVKARPDFRARPAPELHPVRSDRAMPARRTMWRVAIPAMAAAAILAVGVAGWLRSSKPIESAAQPEHRMLATGVGVRDSLRLPDGSRVTLGPLSSVSVAAEYGQKSRNVEVRGDAWFDVVHDAGKPFTVKAGSATIVDVGTRFAVRSDAPDGVAVSVSQGAVSLQGVNTPARQGVILKAGDLGVVNSGGQVVARRGAGSDEDLAWLRGRLVFREASLSEVTASMRRWYGLELRVADPSLAGKHITASFNGESPDRVLDVLGLVLGADIERRGDTAIVRAAKGSSRTR